MHVGAGVAKALCRRFRDLDELMHATEDQLVAIDDVGEVIAQSVYRWFGDPDNRQLIGALRKAGLNFESALYQEAAVVWAIGWQIAGVDGHAAQSQTP